MWNRVVLSERFEDATLSEYFVSLLRGDVTLHERRVSRRKRCSLRADLLMSYRYITIFPESLACFLRPRCRNFRLGSYHIAEESRFIGVFPRFNVNGEPESPSYDIVSPSYTEEYFQLIFHRSGYDSSDYVLWCSVIGLSHCQVTVSTLKTMILIQARWIPDTIEIEECTTGLNGLQNTIRAMFKATSEQLQCTWSGQKIYISP